LAIASACTTESIARARQTIEKCKPVILVEHIKAGSDRLRSWLQNRGYKVIDAGMNLLAIHTTDKTLEALGPQEQAA
jgi:hypothetical protein